MATLARSRRRTLRAELHHRNGFSHFSADIEQCKLDTGVVDCLISWCVLTYEDADKIRKPVSQTNRNKILLNILKNRPYNTFGLFIEALSTDPVYNDLYNEMKSYEVKEELPDVKYADESIKIHDLCLRFQKSYKTLVDQISSPLKLIDVLLELEAFNREDYEDINSLSTVYQKNRELLSKVACKGMFGYEQFLKALKMSNDTRDQELANEVENMETDQYHKLLLQIGITLSHENENVPSYVREMARQLEDTWIKEDAVFVETKGTTKVLKEIQEKNFITVVGSSGSGKTAAMRHVVLKLKFKERYQVIPVDSPDKIIEYRDEDSKQIFLIDDVLGKYSVSPMLLENWERIDTKIQHCLNRNPGKMKLLFTLRKQVVNDKKFSSCSLFITKNIIDLEDHIIALSKEEKQQILIKHLKLKHMEGQIAQIDIDQACTLDYAFPLLCKIVSSSEERLTNIAKIFKEPFSVLEIELRKLRTENKQVYCSLVFCMLFNGIGKDFFNVNLQKHEKFSIVAEACGLNSNVSRKVIEESLLTAVGTYVTHDNGHFRFIHDAFLESISANFAQLNPDVMFSCCEIEMIRDRVRIDSKLPEDDDNVMVINRDQFEVITERLLTECKAGRFSNVLLSHVIKNESFVEYFGMKVSSRKKTATSTLMKKVSTERRIDKRILHVKSRLAVICSCCFCNKKCCFCCKKSTNTEAKKNNKLDKNNAAIKHVIHSPPQQSTFIHWMLATGSYRLFRYFWEKASNSEMQNLLSRDWGCPFTKPFFPVAVLGGNVDIIKTIYSSGADVNSLSCKGETPLSITAKSDRDDIATLLINWGADVNHADMSRHRFPSFICVQNDNEKVLKVLLNNNCDVNLVDIYGTSSTMLRALHTRKRDIVNLLLEFDSKNHPFHAAILRGDVDYVQRNLKKENMSSLTGNGFTPLHYATQVDGTTMIELLFGNHPNYCTKDNNTHDYSLETGRSQDHFPIQSLVEDVNSKNKNGLTPLHLAVLNDHVEAVRFLLKINANVNAVDHFGRIPLHYAQNPVISDLLLNLSITRSKNGSATSVNQSDVVVNFDDGQEEQRHTISWWTAIQNVSWSFLPFRKFLYKGNINQPDDRGNTPLHIIIDTSRDLSMKENYDSAGNIKFLMEHGANIHLRNDNGYSSYDFAHNKDYLHMFSSDNFQKRKTRDFTVSIILLILALGLSCSFLLSPVTHILSRFLNEQNLLNDSLNLNQTNIDALKKLEQRVNDWIMYYFFLICVVTFIMTCIMIIKVVIHLRKTSIRYRIACLIMVPMLQCSAVTLFTVYDHTFTSSRLIFVTFVTIFVSFNLSFAIRIKHLFLLKIRLLQKIFLFQFFLNVILSIFTALVFVVVPVPSDKDNASNTSLLPYDSDIFANRSTINQTFADINITSFQPITNLNCTDNTSISEQSFMSLNYTLVYIIFILIGLFIFPFCFDKTWLHRRKRIIENEYINDIYKWVVLYIFIVLLVITVYTFKMQTVLNIIYYT